ncbi:MULTISPECIES: hypothetical protein [Halorubrum]|uniref:hypothetical protein n=1 Tax=Halorubrum TaxID=56688 RepID=UPI0013052DFF|nr:MULTISPECIES: hypothetical protein [Halorubrum]
MFEQFERRVREIGEQKVFEKHDEPIDGKHRVPERDDSHLDITFPSPREETEEAEPPSEDEDAETDILFKELSEYHVLLSVYTAGATSSAVDTT